MQGQASVGAEGRKKCHKNVVEFSCGKKVGVNIIIRYVERVGLSLGEAGERSEWLFSSYRRKM